MNYLISYLKLINIYYSLTLGLIPHSAFVNYEDLLYYNHLMFHIKMDIEVHTPKKYFFIGGSFDNYFVRNSTEKLNFAALQDAFVFKTGINFYNLELKYEHYCTHPLSSFITNKASERAKYGSYDELSLTLSLKKEN